MSVNVIRCSAVPRCRGSVKGKIGLYQRNLDEIALGMDEDLLAFVPDELYIPMQGMVQSLNAFVAAAIILYEAWR